MHVIRLNPDVVHFNCNYKSYGNGRIANFIGLCLPFMCRVINRKSIVTFHNLAEKLDLAKTNLEILPLDEVGIILVTKLVSLASCVTVTIRSYVEYIKKRYECKRVIYVPHGTWMYDNEDVNEQTEKAVLLFGHMSPYKGLLILLEAFKKVVVDFPEAKLIVAGSENPNFPGFLNMVKNETNAPYIEFTGYVDEENVSKIFKRASVVVLPYLTCIGTSGVFHLACSYGKPIIASDLPEIRELISDGAAALLVPPGNIKRLSNAILNVLKNPKLMKEMGFKNYTFAKKETFDEVAKTFERIYLELTNTRELK
jgi:glycosyltransferase involved in cell wall biosynthesis